MVALGCVVLTCRRNVGQIRCGGEGSLEGTKDMVVEGAQVGMLDYCVISATLEILAGIKKDHPVHYWGTTKTRVCLRKCLMPCKPQQERCPRKA